MKRSTLILVSIIGVVVVGMGVGLWFAFAGPKDKDTTTTTITCKKGTDDCRVEGDVPKDNVGPDAPDPTETLPGGDDPWKKDQQQFDIPWANYNGRGDIVDLHQCNIIGEQDMCWTVDNHSKWKLDYELDFSFYDSSGAKLGTYEGDSYGVKPGEVNKESQEPIGSGTLVPDGTAKVTLDDVQVVGSDCANSGACNDYQQHPENDNY